MNLNELVMKRGKGRGNRNILTRVKTDQNKVSENLVSGLTKKYSTSASSDLNWGKSHISLTNSSASKKSTGSRKSKNEESSSRIIVALTEGRGDARCEVGIAVISVSMPFLILCQISDSQNYINTLTKINIFNPSEILVPTTFVENFSGNRLIDKVKERFPNLKYVGVPRSTYNKINGFEMLNNLCIPSLNGILLVLQHRYYALAAASALICYIQDHVFTYYAPGTIKVDYQESEGYAVIDVSTADHLELVSSTRPAQSSKYSSLFGVLNHCQTKIGARMLRSMILQPPFKAEYIEKRLRCVEELIENPDMLTSIQVLLSKMSNVDSLLSLGTMISNDPLKNSISHLNYVLRLNSMLDLITPLKENLEGFTQPFFIQITKTLANQGFSDIKRVLRETIQDEAQPARGNEATLQKCFVIKPGINGLLDLVRKTYTERMNDMKEYVKALAEKYDLALTVGNNQTKGYHILLNLSKAQKKNFKKSALPDEFIEIHCSAGCCTMKTPELVNLSTRLDDILNDILKISNVMVHAIIVDIKKHIYLFYILCEEIAQLDVFQSLASTSIINNYVRPHFSEFTEITSGRHPLLDILLHTNPVPNNVYCSDDYNVNIITGPNGSGKSIFIRQVLLLQVMAQIGCYVPAQSATFKPMDRMFARIYFEDNMEFGASSFILEMKEMNYIMTSLTNNSIVIIDELGRSTALEEGTALAIAILEKLTNSSAHIYITTHFTLLTRLYDMYPYVKVWQLETIPKGGNIEKCQLDYKFNVIPGITSIKHYGVTLVRDIWPNDILKYVDSLLEKLSKQHCQNVVVMNEKSRLKYNVESLFRKLKLQNELTIFKINEILEQYQTDLKKLGFGINNNLPLESCTQENLSLVENNLVTNGETDPNPALDRFLNDSNLFPLNANNLYRNVEENQNYHEDKSEHFFNADVFEKPAQPKNSIKLADTQDESLHRSNYGEPPLQNSQQTSSLALSNDIDNNQFSMSPSNDLSKSSIPVHFFNNICHYSSSDSSEEVFNMQNVNKCLEDVHDANPRQMIHIPHSDHYSENVINSYHSELDNPPENEFSLKDYIHRNQYEYYVSPVVTVIDGLDNTSISCDDQCDELSHPKYMAGKKINIISDIKILSGQKSIGLKEPQSYGNEPNNRFVSEPGDTLLRNQEFLAGEFQRKLENSGFRQNEIVIGINDVNYNQPYTIRERFDDTYSSAYSVTPIQPPVEKIASQSHSITTSKKIIQSPIDKIISQPEEIIVSSPSHSKDATNEAVVLNISNASTWKLNASSDIENVTNSHREDQKNNEKSAVFNDKANDSSTSILNNHDINFPNSESDERKYNWVNQSNIFNTDTDDTSIKYPCYEKGIIPMNRGNSCETNISERENDENRIRTFTFKKKKLDKLNAEAITTCPFSSSQRNNDIDNRDNKSILSSALNENNSIQSRTSCAKQYSFETACIQMTSRNEANTNILSTPKLGDSNKNATNSSISNDLAHESGSHEDCFPKTGFNGEDSGNCDKTTSISVASKLRKLDEDVTYSTASAEMRKSGEDVSNSLTVSAETSSSVDSKTNTHKTTNVDNIMTSASDDQTSKKHSLSLTSISSASKKRNLDDVSSPFITKPAGSTMMALSKNVDDKSEANCDRRELGMTRRHKVTNKRKFIPPRTLSAKEIRRELEEQDRKILESSQNSLDMKKYWEHIINRPTVQQIRNSTHLALVRKTNNGVQVFPAERKIKTSRRKSPMKRQFSNENFDMSIFSDKNAKTFEEYLNSGERDYKTFSSTVNHCVEDDSSSNFNPFGYSLNLVRNTDHENFVVSNTVTPFYERNIPQQVSINSSQASAIRFSAPNNYLEQNSEFNMANFNATLQNNRIPSVTENNFPSLTPNGYYKQNKEHINTIMNKYLQNTSISSTCEMNNNGERKNIFENTNSSFEDLSI